MKIKSNSNSSFNFFKVFYLFQCTLVFLISVSLYGPSYAQNAPKISLTPQIKPKSPQVSFSSHAFDLPTPLSLLDSEKIYISLTTSPGRLKFLPEILSPILEFVKNQKIEVRINIPKLFRNQTPYNEEFIEHLSCQFSQIPDASIVINRVDFDQGPLTKIAPTIEYLKGKNELNSLVLSLDDDHIYHPQYLKKLIEVKRYFGHGKIISGGGGTLNHWTDLFENQGDSPVNFPYFPNALYDPSRQIRGKIPIMNNILYEVDIVEGFATIIYSPSDIDIDLVKDLTNPNITNLQCYLSDDFVISFVLKLQNNQLLKLQNPIEKPIRHIESSNVGALFRGDGLNPEQVKSLQFDGGKFHASLDGVKYRQCLNSLLPITTEVDASTGKRKFLSVKLIKEKIEQLKNTNREVNK
jgi:hypothetical protein